MQFAGLPDLTSLADAASYKITVKPFLQDFWSFEKVLYGEQSFFQYYITANPLIVAFELCLCYMVVVWILSMATDNYSWVDRGWSIIPTTYSVHFVVRAFLTPVSGRNKNGLLHARLVIFMGMQLLWSARLTRNYYRKGGYALKSEDYRWDWLRQNTILRYNVLFQLFNVVFICIAQNLLLFAISVPAYIIFLVGGEMPLTWRDVILIEVIIFSLTGQLRSDDLQLRYQRCKTMHKNGTANDDNTYSEFTVAELERGFVTQEGWKISRHPAFFLEQVIWVTFYVWSCVATKEYLNYSCIGAIAYIVLFQISTRLTEHISARKYPEYQTYQRLVPILCPLPGYAWSEKKLK